MKMLFKQRFFSWLDSYDIYDEEGNTLFTVQGELSLGHRLVIYDAYQQRVGMVVQKLLTFLPKFELYDGDYCIGCLQKEFTFFAPRYNLDYHGWHVEGSFLEWDYEIWDGYGQKVAIITKEILNWTDTYVIDVRDPEDALCALMFVLAIDAEKCSRN